MSNVDNRLPSYTFGDSGIDKQFLTTPIKSVVYKFQLLPKFLKVRGLVEHLDSFYYFVKTGIKKIVCANDLTVSSSLQKPESL
ncbi:DNA-directed RNA polymerase III subunit RPC2 [Sesbania bispinosa]|nr:DNA-directed RNA polymerase III subunit RPC2 [Sesbania bispinosa]